MVLGCFSDLTYPKNVEPVDARGAASSINKK